MTPRGVSALAGESASIAEGVQREALPDGIRLRCETLESGRVRHGFVLDGREVWCRGHFAEVKCSVVAVAAFWFRVLAELREAEHDAPVAVGG